MDPSYKVPDNATGEILDRLKRAADALDAEQKESDTTIRAVASSKRSVARGHRHVKAVTHKATRFNSPRGRKRGP